jgi:hypothetical protein
MVIEIVGNRACIAKSLDLMQSLPIDFVPQYFSDSENAVDKAASLCADERAFSDFKKINELGYFLHAKACLYDVSFTNYGDSSIFIDLKRKSSYANVYRVLATLAGAGPRHAYAGFWEERKRRNRVGKRFDNSLLESWVGRSIDKYLPGLYWLNLISTDHAKTLNADIDSLQRLAFKYESLVDGDYLLLQMYESPELWEENAGRLDKVCDDINGFFSKEKCIEQLSSASDRKEYEERLKLWP